MRFIQSKGGFLGAFERGTLVGVIGTMRPGCCQPGPFDALRFVPTLLANNPPAAALRVKRWLDEWARHDPREDHWHVGLLTVEPHVQGLGVGTKLMIEHCARMDEAGAVSYLETDKAINVRFYQKFGLSHRRPGPGAGRHELVHETDRRRRPGDEKSLAGVAR